MGSVRFGIPRDLVLALKAKHPSDLFVETGTLEGDSSEWAAGHFKYVWTVDVGCHEKAAKLDRLDNVARIPHTDTVLFLQNVRFDDPAFFWLDAHTDESCPVLKEIGIVNASPHSHVILVDDARLFGRLPAWPSLEAVCEALRDNGRRVTEIVEDVIVATPCR